MNLRQRTLGDIASTDVAATQVFLRHQLDFCCRGHRTLEDACDEAGIEPEQIAREIAEAGEGHGDLTQWARRSQTELADHIEMHYHAGLRRDVPPLIAAARKVERVHAKKPAVPRGLARQLEIFWEQMLEHMGKEEQILFPLIRRRAAPEMIYMPVRAMNREHDDHGEALARLRELTADFQPPEHACATWRALYDGLEALERDLMEHIHLENNLLFRRAVGAG